MKLKFLKFLLQTFEFMSNALGPQTFSYESYTTDVEEFCIQEVNAVPTYTYVCNSLVLAILFYVCLKFIIIFSIILKNWMAKNA